MRMKKSLWSRYDIIRTSLKCIDHGVSLPKPNPNAVEQTAEALSKQMFDNEEFDVW